MTWQERFDAALVKHEKGDVPGCIEELLQLSREYPAVAGIHLILGRTFRETGQLDKAVEHFRQAATLDPSAELSSRALFHSMWELGDRQGAIVEMNRFLAVSKSEHYLEIAAELREKGVL